MKKLSTILLIVLAGCATVPDNLFVLSPENLQRRNIESRKFTQIEENNLLAAVGFVMQDLGFILENSETKLGLVVANKARDADEVEEQVTAMAAALLLGVYIPTKKDQEIRASVVVRPTADKIKNSWTVRATFQRIVTRTDNSQFSETLTDPTLYKEFFTKLSKSVFLEAEKI